MAEPDSYSAGYAAASFRGAMSIAEAMDGKCCRWDSCNKKLSAKTRRRFILCDYCLHVTCLQCDASHEGMNCNTYRKSSNKVQPEDVHQEQFSSEGSRNTWETNSDAEVIYVTNATPQSTPVSQCDAEEESVMPAELSRDELQEEDAVGTAETELSSETPDTTPDTCSVSEEGDAPSVEATEVLECNCCLVLGTCEMVVKIPHCRHYICRTCLESATRSSLTYVVKCPALYETSHCEQDIPEVLLLQNLPKDTLVLHKELRHLPLHQCATDGCIGKCNVKRGMRTFQCSECEAVNCISCMAIHTNMTCEDYIIRVIASLDGYAVDDLQQNGVRCGSQNCNNVGQLVSGSQHSYCPACGELTCLECGVVHTFETCQEYKARQENLVAHEPVLLYDDVPDQDIEDDEEEYPY